MTFVWVWSRCRLELSPLAGPEKGEKGGYMVDGLRHPAFKHWVELKTLR